MNFMYDLIEELCIKKDINITKLCKECNIPRSKLTDFKMGRIKTLSADVISKISDYFGVSMEYLCGAPQSVSNEETLKQVLFGEGYVVSDEQWNKVKEFVESIK